jgi:PAS domain-containing protein
MDANELEALQEKVRFYETVLDNIYNGVIITDPEGKIIFFSSNTISEVPRSRAAGHLIL